MYNLIILQYRYIFKNYYFFLCGGFVSIKEKNIKIWLEKHFLVHESSLPAWFRGEYRCWQVRAELPLPIMPNPLYIVGDGGASVTLRSVRQQDGAKSERLHRHGHWQVDRGNDAVFGTPILSIWIRPLKKNVVPNSTPEKIWIRIRNLGIVTRVVPDIRPTGYPAFFDIRYPAGYPDIRQNRLAGYPANTVSGATLNYFIYVYQK